MHRTYDRKAQVVRVLDEVWSRGELGEIEDVIAPAYTIHHDPGDPWEGRTLDINGYRDRVLKSRAPFPDQKFEILDLMEDLGKVCVSWLWTGSHLGEIAGFPPTGRRLTMSGATVYFFKENFINGHWQITDRLGIFQQLTGRDA